MSRASVRDRLVWCGSLLMFVMTELNQLTGVAALLTFPLDVEVVEAEEREAKEAEERLRAEASLEG
jgi:hypothetical protein